MSVYKIQAFSYLLNVFSGRIRPFALMLFYLRESASLVRKGAA